MFLETVCRILKLGVDLWTKHAQFSVQSKPLLTWILTSKDFHRHRTHPDHCKLSHLPPENNRRWSVLADADKGVLHTREFATLHWHSSLEKAHAGDILKVHDFRYYDYVRRRCMNLSPDNTSIDHLDGDTAFSHDTFHCALLAAGSVCKAIDIVMQEKVVCIVGFPLRSCSGTECILCGAAAWASCRIPWQSGVSERTCWIQWILYL